jgi:hypothetical protein
MVKNMQFWLWPFLYTLKNYNMAPIKLLDEFRCSLVREIHIKNFYKNLILVHSDPLKHLFDKTVYLRITLFFIKYLWYSVGKGLHQ